MPISRHTDDANRTVTISIFGRFTCDVHKEFTDVYQSIRPHHLSSLVIDMTNTEYLDSAALGMLLQVKMYTGLERQDITLLIGENAVAETLSTAHFDALFQIQEVDVKTVWI